MLQYTTLRNSPSSSTSLTCHEECVIMTYYDRNKKEILKKAKLYRQKNGPKLKAARLRLKIGILEKYGTICQCCKESNPVFLTIDHIRGDGAGHRREFKIGSGTATYCWLKRHSFPPGFQVLCFNCNLAKRQEGECPHTLTETVK